MPELESPTCTRDLRAPSNCLNNARLSLAKRFECSCVPKTMPPRNRWKLWVPSAMTGGPFLSW